jgi:hypothetical protein
VFFDRKLFPLFGLPAALARDTAPARRAQP